MKKSFRLILFGILLWIIPFVVSFAFYDSNGKLTTSYDLFKTTMRVVSSLADAWFLYLYFKPVVKDFVKEGILSGLVWLTVNLLLDIIILVPIARMEMKNYIIAIGLGYLQIPIFAFMTGKILQSRTMTVN